MGSPKIISRPPINRRGTGTGTGTGTGGTPTTGPYDRYLGTVGAVADAPKNAVLPHFTEFPAANKLNWVRSTALTGVSGKILHAGEEWVCIADNTPANTPDKWELRQRMILSNPYEVMYQIRRARFLENPPLSILPNQNYILHFNLNFDGQYGEKESFFDEKNVDISLWMTGNPIYSYNAELSVEWTPESSGSRLIGIQIAEFLPLYDMGERDSSGNLLLGERLDEINNTDQSWLVSKREPAIRGGEITNAYVKLVPAFFEYFEYFQTMISVIVSHDAVVPLGIRAARLNVSASRKVF